MKKRIFFIALFSFVCFFVSAKAKTENSKMVKTWKAKVIKVIDGDTIEVRFDKAKPSFCEEKERVRLIGVNSTEMNFTKKIAPEPYAVAARDFTNYYLYNKDVYLAFDKISDTRDKYNRILCYVWINDLLFNEIIVRKGLAYCYDKFCFDTAMLRRIKKAEHQAEMEAIGIWSIQNKKEVY